MHGRWKLWLTWRLIFLWTWIIGDKIPESHDLVGKPLLPSKNPPLHRPSVSFLSWISCLVQKFQLSYRLSQLDYWSSQLGYWSSRSGFFVTLVWLFVLFNFDGTRFRHWLNLRSRWLFSWFLPNLLPFLFSCSY